MSYKVYTILRLYKLIMPYFKEANLLFIHIPKTGGTSFEEYMITKTPISLHSKIDDYKLPDPELQKATMQHQRYQTLYEHRDLLKIDFHNNLKKIAFVRNPYERIMSDIFWLKFDDKNASQEQICDTIRNYYFDRDDIDNHNMPQYRFVTDENENLIPDITILKMENLTDELRKYGFTDYDGPTHTTSYMKYLNKESIEIINTVYKKDFELFGYEMINTSHMMEPHFNPNDTKLFYEILKDSKYYFEYGSGGSTCQAASYNNIRTIHSVESDPEWYNEVCKKIQKTKQITLMYRHLNTVSNTWGYPGKDCLIEDAKEYSRAIRSLSETETKRLDMILIDGRFRVACCLNCFDMISEDCQIVFDDFLNRPHYHEVLNYYDIVRKTEDNVMVVLKKKTNVDSPSKKLLERFEVIPE